MLFTTTRPTLRILQPSSTTTSYTVSSSPLRFSSLDNAFHHIHTALRIALALFCVSLLVSLSGVWNLVVWTLKQTRRIDDTAAGARVGWNKWEVFLDVIRMDGSGARWAGLLSVGLLYWLSRRDYTGLYSRSCHGQHDQYTYLHARTAEESLLIIRGLGVQTSTSSSSLLSSASTRFIPTAQIQDIFIHEAFRGFEVRFYLSVIVREEEQAVVVFPKMLPQRHILEQVWKGSREVLYGSGE